MKFGILESHRTAITTNIKVLFLKKLFKAINWFMMNLNYFPS
jgi:hypothetical protein